VGKAFDVFADGNYILQISVFLAAKHRIVDQDAIDLIIIVGCDDGILELLSLYFSQLEFEATIRRVKRAREQEDYCANHTFLDMFCR
jgi:hypothetical protein